MSEGCYIFKVLFVDHSLHSFMDFDQIMTFSTARILNKWTVKNFTTSWISIRGFCFSPLRGFLMDRHYCRASHLHKFSTGELHVWWFFLDGISWKWREAKVTKKERYGFFLVRAGRRRENLELCIRILIYQLGLIWGLTDTLVTNYFHICFITLYLGEFLVFVKFYFNIGFFV